MDSKPILDTVALLLLNSGLASVWISSLDALTTGAWSDRTFVLLLAAFIAFVVVSARIGRIVDIIARRTLLEWLCLLNISHPETWRSATFTAVWRVVQALAFFGMIFVVINLGGALARIAKTVVSPPANQTLPLPPLP
jgi:hypothetical protein